MATPLGSRCGNWKDRRSLRRRRESEEENFYIDLNRDPTEVLKEVLFHVVKTDVTKSRKLSYLNALVKLCQKDENVQFKVPYADIFCCIRVSLFHEACEVRAAGLRACRYLLQNVEATKAFCQMKLHFLTARSLDVLLDNRLERLHALRLMRKFLCVNPLEFPGAFTNSLVAVVNEGTQERELMRACLATLAQLALLNPEACIAANGVRSLIRNVIDCQQPKIAEAVLGVVLNLYNHPHSRSLMKSTLGLEHLLAPFTDCHFHYPCEALENVISEDRESKLAATKRAIVAVLRSWPGVTYFCQTEHQELPILIQMLYLPYSDIRKNIIDIVFEVFGFNVPDWADDFSAAVSSADPSSVQNSWQLYEGYVVAEANSILPYTSKDRPNLTKNYFSLLLLIFLEAGILEALTEVVISGTIHLAVRSTALLGELLYMCSQLLPFDCCHHCNCLPSLISAAAAFRSPHEQSQASAAVTCLFRIHELKKRGPVPRSLVLDHLMHVCNPGRRKSSFFGSTISKAKLYQYVKRDMTDMVNRVVKDAFMLSKDHQSWDWNLINSILKNPVDALKRSEEGNPRSVIQKLMFFFKPSSMQFSSMKVDAEQAGQIVLTGYHFMEFLLEMEDSKSQEYLGEFLSDVNNCLSEVTMETVPRNCIFSPSNILSTLSQEYFTFIGKLSSSGKGCKLLDKCGTFQSLLNLVSVTNLDSFIKLTVSALDYSKEGFPRVILRKVLTGTTESARLYATNYLRVLLRAGLPDFRKWAIEFLVAQLYDTSTVVSGAAIDILEEACNVPENLEALVLQRPQLLWLGDRGLLLLLRFLSVANGFRYLRDANLLYEEKGILESWRKVYNLKYVKIVEDLLNESLTRHRRNESGTYGRRSSDVRHPVYDVYLPHHLYGQLVQHSDGLEVLKNGDLLPELIATIMSPEVSSDMQLLHLKAALWALGHIGAYPVGLSLLMNEGVVPSLVQLAAEAPVLSVRGTCFFVLGLIGSSPEGAVILSELGWQAVRRNRDEKWPLVCHLPQKENVFTSRRAWSVNSNLSDCPVGRMQCSLSFYMNRAHQSLSTSHSFHSLDAEGSKRSLSSSVSSTASADVPEVRQKANVRPRSSSDCQPNWKDVHLQNPEVSSWESLTSSETRTGLPGIYKERSFSSYEVTDHNLFPERDHSDSSISDSSGHQKSLHYRSCTAENDLSVAETSSQAPVFSLNPVQSSSSVTTCLKGIDCKTTTFLSQLPRGHSCYLGSSSSPDQQSLFASFGDSDTQGYATLKSIQRRRVQSLCIQEQNPYIFDDDVLNVKAHSLGPVPAVSSLLYTHEIPESSSFLKSPPAQIHLTGKEEQSEVSETETRYIGLCLPSDFSLIFSVQKEPVSVFQVDIPALGSEHMGLELHTVSDCLARHAVHEKAGLFQMTINEVEELEFSDRKLEGAACIDVTEEYLKASSKLMEDGPEARTLLRKEVMGCVTNLGSTIVKKASEQRLLNLKQRFPNAFQDICLYSEICLYLARYTFPLPARRFLQELFLDLSFTQLQREAEAIVGLSNIPQLDESDA